MNIRQAYKVAKGAEVGKKVYCPSCGEFFTKEYYQQAFCKTKGGTVCKDKYWNTVIATKRNNTTRISPANARYYREVIVPNQRANYDDDPGWDAHKDSF